MLPWLQLSNFLGRIALPDSFNETALAPYLSSVVDSWLLDLLGADTHTSLLAWLGQNPGGLAGENSVPDEKNEALYALVTPFLVYAVWADYILEGSITFTATGPVEKHRADSDNITDTHRAELRRAYKDKAARYAARITEYLAPTDANCTITPAGRMRFGKASGRTQSHFSDTRRYQTLVLPEFRTIN